MSVTQPLQVLNLYDVLTDLIPGAIVLLFVGLLFPVEEIPIVKSTVVVGFVVLIGALILGHLLQWCRTWRLWKQPNAFQETVEVLEGDADERERAVTPVLIDNDIRDFIDKKLNINTDIDDFERFRSILSYLETRSSIRALRFQSVYSFYRSMFVASVLGVLLAFGVIVITIISPICPLPILSSCPQIPVRSLQAMVGTLIFACILAIACRTRRDKFEKVFVGYVIREFYLETAGPNGEDI